MEASLTQILRKPPTSSTGHAMLLPEGWPRPRGYANGVLARGETIFVGGMIGWDTEGRFPDGFIAQTRQTLTNIVAVLHAGGAQPVHIVRMTWYVVDMDEYRNSLSELGAVYRDVMGAHYPAMTLVEVGRLVEPQARLEIEATAVLPPG
jgi:enamine deaminase RidA (YjgF/YER057c/UK114 family)